MTGDVVRLWWRQFRSEAWVVLALAVLILVSTFLLVAVPRAMAEVADRQLEQQVEALSSFQRDVSATWSLTGMPLEQLGWLGEDGNEDMQGEFQLWPVQIEGAERLRQEQPPTLRQVLQPARFVARITTLGSRAAWVPPLDTGFYEASVEPVINPQLPDDMELVAGEWPEVALRAPFPVVMAAEAAARLHLEVGDVVADTYRLTGLVEAADPQDTRWEAFDVGNRLTVVADPNRGEAGQAWVYLAPSHPGSLEAQTTTTVRVQMWYPVDTADITSGADVAQLQTELTNMLARSHSLLDPETPTALRPITAQFDSRLGGTLEMVISQQRAAAALVALVAVGPLGVAAALMTLGAQLGMLRRESTLELLAARGAAPEHLRTLIWIEGALFALPAALAGHLLARVAVDGTSPWWQWLVTVVVALAAPAALVLALGRPGRRGRADLSWRGGRWRLVAELGVVTLAAAATWQLLARDHTRGGGVDVLAAATPVLCALAAGMLALRLYPVPLAAMARVFKRSTGLTAHLGAARAVREPAGGFLPTLAVLLGTTIAIISVVLLGTVNRGAEVSAWTDVGGDIQVSGPRMSDEVMEQIRGIEGVVEAGRITQTASSRELQADGDLTSVRVWVADEAVGQVWQASPRVEAPPPEVFTRALSPHLVTGGLTPPHEGPVTLGQLGEATGVGHAAAIPGVSFTAGTWVLVSQEAWESAGGTTPPSTLAVVSVSSDADASSVAEAVRAAAGGGLVTVAEQRLAANSEGAVVQALEVAFVGAAGITVALTVLALVVVQLMGAPGRAQLLAILRTLGLRPGESRALMAWEVGPLVVTALVMGAVLGVGIGAVMVGTLDLAGLTGGSTQPSLHLDVPALLGVFVLVLATVGLAVVVSAWFGGRTSLAAALRIGEQR